MPAAVPQPTWRLLLEDRALFVGPLPAPERHVHPPIQISLPLDGVLEVEAGPISFHTRDGVVIGSEVPHAIAAEGTVAHFYVGPASRIGFRLRGWLGARARELPPGWARRARRRIRDGVEDPGGMRRLLDGLAVQLEDLAPAPERSLDPRIARVLEILGGPGPEPRLAELAAAVSLSPDRLRHLFRTQVGVPLRRYRRFARLVAALRSLQCGDSVTRAATESGFADAAHLSRTLRAAFTEAPRELLQNSRFVQAGERGPA